MTVRPLLPLLFVLSISSLAFAQGQQAAENQQAGQESKNEQQKPSPTPTPTVTGVSTYQKEYLCSPKCEAGIGNRIVVHIENLPPEANVKEYAIFLDGQPIKGVLGVPVNGSASLISEPKPTPTPSDKAQSKPTPEPEPFLLEFQLKRTPESREAWAALLGSPSLTNPFRRVVVSVGDPAKGPLPFSDNNQKPEISLRAYNRRWLIGMSIVLLGAIALFAYLAKYTNIIRDSNPPSPPDGKQKPYSLALTQAAVWFFLVFGSFLFIGLVTGDYDTITEQALILMGIGTGTALGAAMIDSTKRNTADTELSTLEPKRAQLEEEVNQLDAKVQSLAGATTDAGKQTLADASVQLKEKQALLKDTIDEIAAAKSGLSKPVSEGFFRDLLTDADGVNFHRFQMLVWTVVLGLLFVIGVYKGLSMPVFSVTLLALMGISAGTYLGFKIPEKQG